MNQILLDGKEVKVIVPDSLPMLIHGQDGSGASLYTICLAAKWFSQGYKVLFLCGYDMAEEEFANQIEGDYDQVSFYTKDNLGAFKSAVQAGLTDNTIVIVKNIELFGGDLLDLLDSIKNLIISGNVNSSDFKDRIFHKKFVTTVYFSDIDNKNLQLKKYEGLVTSGDYQGVTMVQK